MSDLTFKDFAWHVRANKEEPFQFFLSSSLEDPSAGADFLKTHYVVGIPPVETISALEKASSRDYTGVIQFAQWLTGVMHNYMESSVHKSVGYAFEILQELTSYLQAYDPNTGTFDDLWAFMYLDLVCQNDWPPAPAHVVNSSLDPKKQIIAFPTDIYKCEPARWIVLSRAAINQWWKDRFNDDLRKTFFITELESLSDALSYAQVYVSAYDTFATAVRNVENGLQRLGEKEKEDAVRLSHFAINAMAMAASQVFNLSAPERPAQNTRSTVVNSPGT